MIIQSRAHIVDVHALSFFTLQSDDATTHFETAVTCVLNTSGKNVDISVDLYMHE